MKGKRRGESVAQSACLLSDHEPLNVRQVKDAENQEKEHHQRRNASEPQAIKIKRIHRSHGTPTLQRRRRNQKS
jgi:hypothetical protein